MLRIDCTFSVQTGHEMGGSVGDLYRCLDLFVFSSGYAFNSIVPCCHGRVLIVIILLFGAGCGKRLKFTVAVQ